MPVLQPVCEDEWPEECDEEVRGGCGDVRTWWCGGEVKRHWQESTGPGPTQPTQPTQPAQPAQPTTGMGVGMDMGMQTWMEMWIGRERARDRGRDARR